MNPTPYPEPHEPGMNTDNQSDPRKTLRSKPGPKATDPAVRFWRKVDKSDECWLWQGGKNQNGYGLFKPSKDRTTAAHRYAYELSVGPIEPRKSLDHICRTPSCVRPDHLRQVTAAENQQHQEGHRDSKSGRRGVSWYAKTGQWRPKVTKNGKHYFAGLYDDLDEAAEVARQLRLRLHTHNDLDRRSA